MCVELRTFVAVSQDYWKLYLFLFVDGGNAGSGADIDTVLIAVVRMMRERSVAERSLLEPTRDEYVTRHLIDGRIIYSDHRYDSPQSLDILGNFQNI
jgi:hypothetical protein